MCGLPSASSSLHNLLALSLLSIPLLRRFSRLGPTFRLV